MKKEKHVEIKPSDSRLHPASGNFPQPEIIGLEERLRFEEFISELSAKFINLPHSEIDDWIDQSIKQVVEFLAVDRSSLMEFSEDKEYLIITHSYAKPEFSPLPIMTQLKRSKFPWTSPKILMGEIVSFSSVEELPQKARTDRENFAEFNIKSNITVPLSIGGAVQFVIAIAMLKAEKIWPLEMVSRLRLIGEILVNALDRKRREEELHQKLEEIHQLKEQVEAENLYLRESLTSECGPGEIVGQSVAMQKVMAQVKKVAPTNSTVLIEGETGVGKELIARVIHKLSARKNQLMVTVNCATLPAALIESELFGRESGAYTGALSRQIGRFEIADRSTIFLDEIGELPPELQTKLLRVLEEGEFERLGSPKEIKVNVRVIASTNRDLAEEVRKGNFRKDLYYRLRVFPIHMPPLRERLEDIPVLVRVFVLEFEKKMGKKIKIISRKSLEDLQHYSWPGNIRELRNAVEYAMINESNGKLVISQQKEPDSGDSTLETLEKIERQHILKVLEQTNWRIKGRNGAAEILGINSSTLYFRMKKMNIPIREDRGN